MTILQIKSFPIKIILFFFLVIGAFAVLTLIPITKYRIFNVQTGSMQPTINTGSMIVVKAVSEYRVNDIITFINPNYSKQTSVTHRIVSIEEKDGKVFYITKGDANMTSDYNKVGEEKIIGKVLFSVPYLGYIITDARSPLGLAILIIIPASMIIFGESKKIWQEVKRSKKSINLSE